MWAWESTTASSASTSMGMVRLSSAASRRWPWKSPQSSSTVAREVRSRCLEPVTVWAAPMNSSSITRGLPLQTPLIGRLRTRFLVTA